MLIFGILIGFFVGASIVYGYLLTMQIKELVEFQNKTSEEIQTLRDCMNANSAQLTGGLNTLSVKIHDTNQRVQSLSEDKPYLQ